MASLDYNWKSNPVIEQLNGVACSSLFTTEFFVRNAQMSLRSFCDLIVFINAADKDFYASHVVLCFNVYLILETQSV